MSEREKDFLKLKTALRRVSTGEFNAKQIGTLWRQYAAKYIDSVSARDKSLGLLDGGVFIPLEQSRRAG